MMRLWFVHRPVVQYVHGPGGEEGQRAVALDHTVQHAADNGMSPASKRALQRYLSCISTRSRGRSAVTLLGKWSL